MPLDRLTKLDPLQLGRFRVLARLGGGGMGNVYLAEADDGTPAAVKVIKAELAQDTQFRARFRREVEAGRRVNSRCIARYLDADTYAASPWLATEFVPGPTLHHQVHARGPVVGPRVIGLAVGLADALVAIHAAGLVHRDLKPANILLAPDAPKVIDFGISLAADATVLTTTGTLVGSPAYMSPEQAKGMKDVGAPADVFSWASCMTFASRREPPFGEGEAAGLLYKVVHEQPDLSGVPAGLLPFVQASLDKDPANRPTAAELVAGLTSVLDGVPAARLVAAPAGGGAARVLAPVGAGDARRVLDATWAPDHEALEEAERMLAEAHELRASLPPRAEERRRRVRSRANRAVFAAMAIGFLALLVVGFVTIRPGQPELAKALDNGQGPDAQPSTTTTTAATTSSAVPAAPPAYQPAADPAAAAAGGAAPVPAGGPAASAPAPSSAPSPTSAGAPAAPPQTTVATAATCTARVLNAPPGGPENRLPTWTGGPDSTYAMRVTVSTSMPPGSSLVLVRQRPTAGQPPVAWTRPITTASAATVDVGRFAMQVEPDARPAPLDVTVHREPPG
ncbi:MAG: serine/threonine-protein kinase, partial [Acidimicrobiia bacterium]